MMIDFDGWRANYDAWTVADQQAFHDEIFAAYPEQSHYNADTLVRIIEERRPEQVLELGGWDGECASDMLTRFDFIEQWRNVELSGAAIAAGFKDTRYVPLHLDTWYWQQEWKTDLFVASHVLEHLKGRDVEAVLRATDATVLYLDAPIEDMGHSWQGTTTTHIIEIGWLDIDRLAGGCGYRLVDRRRHSLPPRSGGFSVVSVYEKET